MSVALENLRRQALVHTADDHDIKAWCQSSSESSALGLVHNIFAKDQFCCLRVCSDPRAQFFVTISVTGFSPLEPNLEFEKFSRGHR